MLTKFNEMNTLASNEIISYIKNGYRIDAKESAIDREKYKDCIFKAVLKKDIDRTRYKTVITLTYDEENRFCMYHKVDMIDNIRQCEETHTYSALDTGVALGDTDALFNMTANNDFYNEVYKPKNNSQFEHEYNNQQTYQTLNDYIQLNNHKKDSRIEITPAQSCEKKSNINSTINQISIDTDDSFDSIYNKIIDHRKKQDSTYGKDCTEDTCSKRINEKHEACSDEVEDSIIKLVRYIFGK